ADRSRIVLSRSLPAIESGTAPRTKQDESQATTFGKRTPADGEIDWNKSALDIFNLVRALTHPFPGAFTHIDGKKTFVWRACILEMQEGFAPGEIVSRRPLTIAARDGLLLIQSLQPEGEPEVSYHS
ncbi:formyltransferase, partial [Synergistaceae bacterium OttesenSCG-928-I11]|nr:formyltransferase [Synergistaceae bacterium OttesenSCG-928-I11]